MEQKRIEEVRERHKWADNWMEKLANHISVTTHAEIWDSLKDIPALLEEIERLTAQKEAMERAMYTSDTLEEYDSDKCCMFCKYGDDGTCAGFVEHGNPNNGYEFEHECNRCKGTTINERGGWEFDYERFGDEAALKEVSE